MVNYINFEGVYGRGQVFGSGAFSCVGLSGLLGIFAPLLLLILLSFATLMERRLMAGFQHRLGPVITGPWGLMQGTVDGLKLFFKEGAIGVSFGVFSGIVVSLLLLFVFGLLQWYVIFANCDSPTFAHHSGIGILLLFLFSGYHSCGVVVAGLSGRSRYAQLGAVRACAQYIVCELCVWFNILVLVLLTGSISIRFVYLAQYFAPMGLIILPVAVLFFLSLLLEVNRAPFDLPEGEGEIVAGFTVDFGGLMYAVVALGEYMALVQGTLVFCLLFFGIWLPLGFMVVLVLTLFVLIRAALPRCRYDAVFGFGWRTLLPLSFSFYTLLLVGTGICVDLGF